MPTPRQGEYSGRICTLRLRGPVSAPRARLCGLPPSRSWRRMEEVASGLASEALAAAPNDARGSPPRGRSSTHTSERTREPLRSKNWSARWPPILHDEVDSYRDHVTGDADIYELDELAKAMVTIQESRRVVSAAGDTEVNAGIAPGRRRPG